MAYCFRTRFDLPEGVCLGIDHESWSLTQDDVAPAVAMHAGINGKTIRDAKRIVLKGGPYPSDDDAAAAGEQWRDALTIAFAKLRVGADFGDRAPKGSFTEAGLAMFRERLQAPVLNDVHGLLVFECEPSPRFVGMAAGGTVVKSQDTLAATIGAALQSSIHLSSADRLAYDLFSASFFERSSDARFLLLMMAIETLLTPQPREEAARTHLLELIELTRRSGLSISQRDSLCSALQSLMHESIGQAGRRLAQTLGERKYMDLSPTAFFSQCYGLRSRLVHGAVPRPSRGEIGVIASNLEGFVGDLLSFPHLPQLGS